MPYSLSWQSSCLQKPQAAGSNPPTLKTQTFCKQKTASVSLHWRSFYGRGWITQAAHLKKPRRGFFPRRTVRRVDAVRIHPPSLREGYYKTETPVPDSDTGVLGGRGWITQAALLKTAHRAVFAPSSATGPHLFESTRMKTQTFCKQKTASVSLR